MTTPITNPSPTAEQSIKDTLASLTIEEVHAGFPAVFAAPPKQTPADTAMVNELVKQGITPLAMFKRNIPPIADLFSEWVTGNDGKKTRDYTNGAKRLMTIDLLVDTVDSLEVKVTGLINQNDALTKQNNGLTAQAGALVAQAEALTNRNEALTAYVNDLAARLDALDAKLEQRATMPTVETRGEAPTTEAPTTEAPTQPIKDLGGVPAKINAEMSKIEKAKAKAKDFAAKNAQPAQAPVAQVVQAPVAQVVQAPVVPTASPTLAQSAVAEAIAMDFGDVAGSDDAGDADLEV